MVYFDQIAFSKAIKQKRFVELGIDLRKAASQIKVNFTTLSRIEKGSMPELNNAIRICYWLKVPITEFIKKG